MPALSYRTISSLFPEVLLRRSYHLPVRKPQHKSVLVRLMLPIFEKMTHNRAETGIDSAGTHFPAEVRAADLFHRELMLLFYSFGTYPPYIFI